MLQETRIFPQACRVGYPRITMQHVVHIHFFVDIHRLPRRQTTELGGKILVSRDMYHSLLRSLHIKVLNFKWRPF